MQKRGDLCLPFHVVTVLQFVSLLSTKSVQKNFLAEAAGSYSETLPGFSKSHGDLLSYIQKTGSLSKNPVLFMEHTGLEPVTSTPACKANSVANYNVRRSGAIIPKNHRELRYLFSPFLCLLLRKISSSRIQQTLTECFP